MITPEDRFDIRMHEVETAPLPLPDRWRAWQRAFYLSQQLPDRESAAERLIEAQVVWFGKA